MRAFDIARAQRAHDDTAPQAGTPNTASIGRAQNDPPEAERIGALIAAAKNLSEEQVSSIAAFAQEHGIRFGEAAVAMSLASEDDVRAALSSQYRYAVVTVNKRSSDAPPHISLVAATQPFSKEAEAFRTIRAQLKMRLSAPNATRRPVAVLSTHDGDGRSYFAANLAIAFSQLGERTLLIDADLRRPGQHELFGLTEATGLSSVLAGRVDSHAVHRVASLPNLFVLPVGPVPPNPLELVESVRLTNVLSGVMEKFDHVVVDTSAFEHGMDGPVVAAHCGLGLLVVRSGQAKLARVQDLLATLSRGMTEIAGVVLNER